MLGTMEGGFLVNLRGMFVLELPGPRILVFVKVLIVQVMPDLKPATDLTVGILGVIDLDFPRRSFTHRDHRRPRDQGDRLRRRPGRAVHQASTTSSNWHLYIGTFGAPASAMVLNIVRGFGYVMIAGHDIDRLAAAIGPAAARLPGSRWPPASARRSSSATRASASS